MTHQLSLEDCLRRLRWTPERLAREVNRAYGPGTVSAKAPYGWLKGAFPRGGLPEWVATVLSDRLGEVVEVGDLWPGRDEPPDPCGPAAWRGVELGWFDASADAPPWPWFLDRRGRPEPADEQVPGAVVATVAREWLAAAPLSQPGRRTGDVLPEPVLDALSVQVEELCGLAEKAPRAGWAQEWAAHELRWVALLASRSRYSGHAGARLLGLLGECAWLAGWTPPEAADPVRAQRYLLLGLRAAMLADDRPLAAQLLWGLGYRLTMSRDETHAGVVLDVVHRAMSSAGPEAADRRARRRTRTMAGLDERDEMSRTPAELAPSTLVHPSSRRVAART